MYFHYINRAFQSVKRRVSKSPKEIYIYVYFTVQFSYFNKMSNSANLFASFMHHEITAIRLASRDIADVSSGHVYRVHGFQLARFSFFLLSPSLCLSLENVTSEVRSLTQRDSIRRVSYNTFFQQTETSMTAALCHVLVKTQCE